MSDPQFPEAVPVDASSEAAWLASRRTFIGASESPTILGVGYAGGSPVGIWDSKVMGAAESAAEVPLKFQIGKRKEPLMRALFSESAGLACVEPAAMAYRHKVLTMIGCSLDGETLHPEFGRCPVELKNMGAHALADWESDEPPLKYQVQVQHQLLVTGAKVGFLMGLIADEHLIIREIKRDDAFLAALAKALQDFWRYVERRELPPLDASEATARALAHLYPKDAGTTIELPPAAVDWVAERESASATISEAEARKTAAENQLKAALAEHTTGTLPDGRKVTWKTQERKGYTVAPSTSRVLRVSNPKE